jgi:hypothetical protein
MTTTHHTSEQHIGLTGPGRPATWQLQLLVVACEAFILFTGLERRQTCKQALGTRTAARIDTPGAVLQKIKVLSTPLNQHVDPTTHSGVLLHHQPVVMLVFAQLSCTRST